MICELRAVSAADIERADADPESLNEAIAGGGLSLEKAWHALHYLLTGTAWGGDLPLGFLLTGGRAIEELDMGYGPARLLSPDEVIAVANALDGVSDAELDRRFDLGQMAAAELYPPIWDEGRAELLQEYLDYFHQLQQFVRDAARQRMGLLVFLG